MANNKSPKSGFSFDWKYFMQQCIRKWPWFVASVLICCAVGALKYKLTAPLAQVNAKVLVSDDSSKGSGGIASLMAKQFDLGNMLGGTGSVYNEMQVMGSHSVFENTVKELDLNCCYLVKLKLLKPWIEPWDKTPVRLDYNKTIADTLGVALFFTFDVDESGRVNYKVKERRHTLAKGSKVELPCAISTAYGEFTLSPTKYMPKGKSFKEKIVLQGYSSAAEGYEKLIGINTMSKKVDVVGYTFITSNPEFGQKILSSLIDNYNKSGIRQKREKGAMTAEFLDKRLTEISSGLNAQETQLQDYKQQRGLTLVEQDAQLAYKQAKTLRNQLVTAEAEFEIMKLVCGFIEDPVNSHSLVPAVGEWFSSASTAITTYNEVIIERMRLMNNARENNAALKLVDEQLEAMRGNIKLTLVRGMETYQARMDELRKEVAKAESLLGAVPETEREFIGLERNRAVQEKLYLYLLQQQEENAMRMDASLPRGVVIDAPYVSGEPIGLSLSKTLAISFLLGLCIPGGFIFVRERLRRKITSAREVQQIVNAPILAELKTGELQDRLDTLAANVKCMLAANDGNTVLVTSADNADNKCAVACGLAKTMAETGMKVLLLELDFRSPQLASELGISPSKGIVQYLTENLDPVSILTHVSSGLDAIVAGAVPPNPTYLITSAKLKDFIGFMSERYDCVVIDAATVKDYSDTTFISQNVTATVCICGIGSTDVDYLPKLSQMVDAGTLTNVGIVVTASDK